MIPKPTLSSSMVLPTTPVMNSGAKIEYKWKSSLPMAIRSKYKFLVIDDSFLSLQLWSDKAAVCFPRKGDPCYMDHFHSDSLDKFDICFTKNSKAAIKKMPPSGPLDIWQLYLLMCSAINSYCQRPPKSYSTISPDLVH